MVFNLSLGCAGLVMVAVVVLLVDQGTNWQGG
jgi:hypothetical protein